MKKFAIVAPAALLALGACGESTDASEEAVADTVEVPADAAMADAPEPVADGDISASEATSIEEAVDEASAEAEAAADAADAAQATVDDVLSAVDAAETASEAVQDVVD